MSLLEINTENNTTNHRKYTDIYTVCYFVVLSLKCIENDLTDVVLGCIQELEVEDLRLVKAS